jgi:hypothetical protein
MARGNPDKTITSIDLRDLYDKVWEAAHKQEAIERKTIGITRYIREYIIRPFVEKKEGK